MPPPKISRPVADKPVIATSEEFSPLLAELLDAPEWSRNAILKDDWNELEPNKRDELLFWFCKRYGLDPRLNHVCMMKLKDGRLIPYIKAQGVFEVARPKIKSMTLSKPEFVYNGGRLDLVTIVSTIKTKDDSEFSQIGCTKNNGEPANTIMKAGTVAHARACKLAVGIHLLVDSELQEREGTQ